jgi:hypothetical protein
MATDDEFFTTDWLDVFASEVEALVISVYKAAIAGIEASDKKERTRLRARDLDSDPAALQESRWRDEQIQAMKYHAGNMGLASLIVLFDDWLAKRHKEAFPEKDNDNWKSRFEQLEKHLCKGPLPLAEPEEMVIARNSIIHHRGKSTYENRGERFNVNERFLIFDEDSGQERVAIEESLLENLASNLAAHVNFWNQQMRKQDLALKPGPPKPKLRQVN